jgi:hypothetical protein
MEQTMAEKLTEFSKKTACPERQKETGQLCNEYLY